MGPKVHFEEYYSTLKKTEEREEYLSACMNILSMFMPDPSIWASTPTGEILNYLVTPEKIAELQSVRTAWWLELGKINLKDLTSEFTWNVHKEHLKQPCEDCTDFIISTNYDLLIEHAVHQFRYLHFSEKNGKTPIIKLHGSINWFDKAKVSLEFHEKISESINDPNDRKEVISFQLPLMEMRNGNLTVMDPVIIPPSISKNYQGLFNVLYERAFKWIAEADELIIIGYGFSQNDEKANNLLSEGLKKNLKKIKVFHFDINQDSKSFFVVQNPEVRKRINFDEARAKTIELRRNGFLAMEEYNETRFGKSISYFFRNIDFKKSVPNFSDFMAQPIRVGGGIEDHY